MATEALAGAGGLGHVPGVRLAAARSSDGPGRRDLCVLAFPPGTRGCCVLTTNKLPAAPVTICRERLPGPLRGVLVNASNANALTGAEGLRRAQRLAQGLAGRLGVPDAEVVPCSTGMIGAQLDESAIEAQLDGLVAGLAAGSEAGVAAAEAIWTSDTFRKEYAVRVRPRGEEPFVVGGTAKGTQMISPGMATTLCFLATDAGVGDASLLQELLVRAVAGTFNEVSIDGNQSTNDTVLLADVGEASTRPSGARLAALRAALQDVCKSLCEQVLQDGGGASTTRLVEFRVVGAASAADAALACRAVALDQMVKIHLGNMYMMGVSVIVSALGASGVSALEPGRLGVRVGEEVVVRDGLLVEPFQAYKKRIMPVISQPRFQVTIDLGLGAGAARVVTTDLNEGYIRAVTHASGSHSKPTALLAAERAKAKL